MVHVFDKQDVVVERFFVFRVTLALTCHDSRGFFRNDLQALKHGFVDTAIRVVDHASDLQLIATFSSRGQHVFDCNRKMGEGLHEGDYALAFLYLDFCVFDRADLLVQETVE